MNSNRTKLILAAVLLLIVSNGGVNAQFTKLHDFNRGTDGGIPRGGVAVSGTTIFGTAWLGGANDNGTLWSFDLNTNVFTDLHDFNIATDGGYPEGSIVLSGSTVFGTAGGGAGHGILWSFDTTTNAFNKLHDITGGSDFGGALGVAMSGTTIFGTTGVLDPPFGALCVIAPCGILWSFDTSANAYSILYDFATDPRTNGSNPTGGVAVSGTTVYGTARLGGEDCSSSGGCGTIWSLDTSTNTFTKLHDFDGADRPRSNVALSGTAIYGTASGGGANGRGTIWSFDTSTNVLTTLHDFDVTDGGPPIENGIAIAGTTLFGTARGGVEDGIIWSFDTSTNTFTKLHDFVETDGDRPVGQIAVSGSTVYGTTEDGGSSSVGVGTLWSFVVPEPASYSLGAMGLFSLLSFRRCYRFHLVKTSQKTGSTINYTSD